MIRTAQPPLLALVALWLLAGPGAPLRAQSKENPSLDDELMKQLQADPVDDVDRELFGPGRKQPAGKDAPDDRKGAPPKEGEDLKQKLSRELGPAAVAEDDDPLLSVARRMREVESLIARTQSGDRTQQTQQQIVAELEKLIQQARKSCKKGSSQNAQSQATPPRAKVTQPSKQPGAGQGDPKSKPAADSNAKAGQSDAKKPDVEQMRALIEKQLWGGLPLRQRQQLLQLPMEEFLPKYESLIIEYFKRLSEEQGKRER